MELNNIRNRNFLYEGQVLALASSARAAPPVEAEVPVEVVAAAPVAEPAEDTEAAEPTSEREAEEIGPALVAGTQAAESADPADYSVADGDVVLVQAAETLGHYAEWLDVRASDLRRLNKMSFATPVIVGRKVKLSFAKVTHDQFEARRMEYHRQLQEVFFTQFRIKDTADARGALGRVDLGASRNSATTFRSGCCASTTPISISATSARARSS